MLYLPLFLVVEHMCQVPVGGKKEGEIKASPQSGKVNFLKGEKPNFLSQYQALSLFIC